MSGDMTVRSWGYYKKKIDRTLEAVQEELKGSIHGATVGLVLNAESDLFEAALADDYVGCKSRKDSLSAIVDKGQHLAKERYDSHHRGRWDYF